MQKDIIVGPIASNEPQYAIIEESTKYMEGHFDTGSCHSMVTGRDGGSEPNSDLKQPTLVMWQMDG